MKVTVNINGLRIIGVLTKAKYQYSRKIKYKDKTYEWKETRLNAYIPREMEAEEYVVIPVIEPFVKIEAYDPKTALLPSKVSKK